MRKILVNAVGRFRAGEIFDPDQGQQGLIEGIAQLGGAFVDESLLTLAAAERAAAAYGRGDPAAASGIMLAAIGGGGGGGSGSAIAWSPLGNGNAVTWADVVALRAAASVPGVIYLTDVAQNGPAVEYVVDEVGDIGASTFEAPVGGDNQAMIRIVNGGQIRNGGFRQLQSGMFTGGMTVRFEKTDGIASLAWDSADESITNGFAGFGWGGGASLENVGTTSAIVVKPALPDSLLVAAPINTANVKPGTAPIIELGAGAFLFVSILNNGIGTIDPSWLQADASNLIGIISEDFDFAQTLLWTNALAATVINNPVGMAGGSGPTSRRPFGAIGPLIKGTTFFDTDLVPPRPIYWDGFAFYNAVGAGPLLCPHSNRSTNSTPQTSRAARLVNLGCRSRSPTSTRSPCSSSATLAARHSTLWGKSAQIRPSIPNCSASPVPVSTGTPRVWKRRRGINRQW